jgi:hypothetical protein
LFTFLIPWIHSFLAHSHCPIPGFFPLPSLPSLFLVMFGKMHV